MADGVQKNYPIFLGTTLVSLESGILYRGYAKTRVEADTSVGYWLISREYILSGITYVEHASFNHDQIWDDRAGLFPVVVPDPGSPGDTSPSTGPSTSFTREHVNVTNVAQAFAPVADQISIRFVPNAAGTFAYGPDGAVLTTNAETFNQTSPVEIETNATVYLIRNAASAVVNMVVYRFIRT